ncbi:hypothetical protein EIP86_008983 [Pleurotus ostreatoroseus]|nr:hypothetical protein EIP86_008983 [Pleurotus ostreatoroseus]
MPPKRPHDDASTSRPRKRAKREEDSGSDFEQRESDEVYDFDEDSELFEESSDSEPPEIPVKKKRGKMPAIRKTSLKKKTAGRRSRVDVTIEVLLNQPLDIIVEIFGFLGPLDVLHLARASKFVRSKLMNPVSMVCWQATWTNAKGLPPCPVDMAAPAFVSLMYSYQRFTWDDIESGFRLDGFMLDTVIPTIDEEEHFFEKKFSEVRYKWELQVCARFEDVAEFKSAWRRYPVAERKRFLKDRQAKVEARKKHAELCYEWLEEKSNDVEDQTAIALARRYEAIVVELKAKGWTKVLEDMTADEMEDFRDLPDLRKTQKVTKGTLKSMLPRLETFLNTCKKNHARSSR